MPWENRESQETKFNMAFATMQRINESLVLYAHASYNRDVTSMYSSMRNLYIELEIYIDGMKESKFPNFKETLYIKRLEVEKYLKSYQNIEMVLTESKQIHDREALKHIKEVLFNQLEDYNILLRKIIAFKKLGMPEVKFSAEDAFDEGYDE